MSFSKSPWLTSSEVAQTGVTAQHDFGVFYRDFAHFGEVLRDEAHMARLRGNAWPTRGFFTFDAHADTLIAYFRDVMARRGGRVR